VTGDIEMGEVKKNEKMERVGNWDTEVNVESEEFQQGAGMGES
jgi:translation elongation factor EF-Tu-like GTPase